MKEETYSYKTPSAQLVKIAEIASQYKGRPEMVDESNHQVGRKS